MYINNKIYLNSNSKFNKHKKYTKENWNLSKLSTEFNNIELDLSYQRRGAWEEKQRNAFIISLIEGTAFTNICIANVNHCLEYCKRNNYKDSIDYFKTLKLQGKKYISIDGNNRTTTIKMFLNDEIIFPSINIELSNGKIRNIEGKTFSELKKIDSETAKIISEKFNIPVTIIKSHTKSELHQTFVDINESEPLNDQERRNARKTIVSEKINELSKKYEIKLKELINNSYSYMRRYDETLLTTLLLIEHDNLIPTHDNLNKIFFEEEVEDTFKRLDKNLNILFNKMNINFGNKSPRRMSTYLINQYLLIKILENKNIKIKNYKELHTFFKNNEKRLRTKIKKRINEKEINLDSEYSEAVRYKDNPTFLTKRIHLLNQSIEKYKDKVINFLDISKKEKLKNMKVLTQSPKIKSMEKYKSKLTKQIYKINENHNNKLIRKDKKLSEMFQFKKEVYLDETYQRRGAWNLKGKQNFLKSLLLGKSFTEIIVLNIEKSLKSSKTQEDISYYKELLKNYKYISLDGNNRTTTISELLNSEISFPDIRFSIGGETYNLKGKYYNELNDEVSQIIKKYIDNISINISYISDVSNNELNKLFLNVNQGVPVNNQEKRNAKLTEVSKYIRALSKQYKNVLIPYYKEKEYIRRMDEKQLSVLLSLETRISKRENLNISSKDEILNKLFDNDIDKEAKISLERNLKEYIKIINYINNKRKYNKKRSGGEKLDKELYFFYIYLKVIEEDNKSILDIIKIYEEYKIQDKLRKEIIETYYDEEAEENKEIRPYFILTRTGKIEEIKKQLTKEYQEKYKEELLKIGLIKEYENDLIISKEDNSLKIMLEQEELEF